MGNSLCCAQNGAIEDLNNDVTTIEIQKHRYANQNSARLQSTTGKY